MEQLQKQEQLDKNKADLLQKATTYFEENDGNFPALSQLYPPTEIPNKNTIELLWRGMEHEIFDLTLDRKFAKGKKSDHLSSTPFKAEDKEGMSVLIDVFTAAGEHSIAFDELPNFLPSGYTTLQTPSGWSQRVEAMWKLIDEGKLELTIERKLQPIVPQAGIEPA